MTTTTVFQKIRPHLIAVITFLVICSVYFIPQFQGKVLQAGDIVSYLGMSKEIRDFKEKTGERSLWTNAMFGGMPTYQIDSSQPNNLMHYFEKAGQLFIDRPIGYSLSAMLIFYLLMVLLGVNPWLSMIGAVVFGLNTNSLILMEAGHMTKVRVIAFFGMTTAGMLLAFRKKYLLGGILFATGLGVELYANHVQMIYYLFLVFAIYGIIELIRHIQAKEMASFLKAVLVLVVGAMIAIGSSTSKLWTTYEYAKDTMRGDPILVSEASEPRSSSNTEGLEWGYAMNWSNGFLDLFASYIPGVVGGSSSESVGMDSESVKSLRRQGARINDSIRLPLYWGSLPGTSGPAYFGAAMCFLFVLGLFLVRGSLKWWLGLGVLLTLLLSMGKHFEFFNKLLFDYFPLFNKFRTPNSVLAITSFLVPILGIVAVSDIVKGKVTKEQIKKALMISFGITGGIALFFALIGPSFFDFSYNVDATHSDEFYAQNYGLEVDKLKLDRQSLMQSDGFRTFAIVALCAGLLFAFLKEKINQTILVAGLAVVAIFDIWNVDRRYLNEDSFVNKRQYEAIYTPRPVDEDIMQDKDPNYRVFDISGGMSNAFNSSKASYFHKTIGGYHPAKLQRAQDLIDHHISEGNQAVLDMLNMKYVIMPEEKAQRNPGALGNAWFVSTIKTVATPNEEIDALDGFNPAEEAVVNDEFSDYISGLNLQKNGTINLTDYKPNHLTYQSNTTSEQLAVFSEIWYGPNKGWQAYIDGNPAEHIRVNYALRAMKVPVGEYTIEFKFDPKTYRIGETITLIFSLIIMLSFFGYFGYEAYKALQQPDAPTNTQTTPQKPLKPTKSKGKDKRR